MPKEMYLGRNRLTNEYFFDDSNVMGKNRVEDEGLDKILGMVKVAVGERATILHTDALSDEELNAVRSGLRKYPVCIVPIVRK